MQQQVVEVRVSLLKRRALGTHSFDRILMFHFLKEFTWEELLEHALLIRLADEGSQDFQST